jgi:hypothetical protein
MSFIPYALLGGAFYPYKIDNALRLNAADSAYLDWVPSSTDSDRTKEVLSLWVKRTTLNASGQIFLMEAYTNNDNRFGIIYENDDLRVFQVAGGSFSFDYVTNAKFRDPSAAHHLFIRVDTSDSTPSNRVRLWINGDEITSFSTENNPAQNEATSIGINTARINFGRAQVQTSYFDGYISEVIHVAEETKEVTDFGEFKNGIWVPKRYTGNYGTNGFRLNFSDAANLGKDVSGNGNDFTENNITSDDQVGDTPTNNTATYNAVDPQISGTSNALSMAGHKLSTQGAYTGRAGSTFFLTSGKWYWEYYIISAPNLGVGVSDGGNDSFDAAECRFYNAGGAKQNNGTKTGGYGASYAATDIIGVALDLEGGTIEFFKNGTSQGVAFSDLAGKIWTPTHGDASNADQPVTNLITNLNSFNYTPPTGFKPLNAANLPKPKIINGGNYFNAVTYTGNGGTQSITGVGFQPDLVWIKQRNGSAQNFLYDTVRGAGNDLRSDSNAAESFFSNTLQSFDNDGFTVGDSSGINTSGDTFVAWCWKKGVTPGFDIVGYTGDGTQGATVDHGLGTKPAIVLVKNRDDTDGWVMYHQALPLGAEQFLTLDLNATARDQTNIWDDTEPNATEFTIGDSSAVNTNGEDYIAYVWSEVPGFSRFGLYEGNGSSEGPFVWCGFRPAVVIIKNTNTQTNWVIKDRVRSPYNDVSDTLFPDVTADENDNIALMDFLSNGFKLRGTSTNTNVAGENFAFMAFAENPFKYSNAR